MKKGFAMMLALLLLTGVVCTQGQAAQSELLGMAQGTLAAMMNGEYEAITAQFDEAMRAAVDASGLEAAWGSVLAQLGAVTGVTAAQADEASRTAALALQHEAGSTTMVIVYDAENRIAGMSISPQSAAQPIARELPEGTTAQHVTLFAGTQRELAGELLTPDGAGAHTPYAVLVHGSGPSDMDETIGGCKPLRDLAYDLAAAGVGSLRFDKITYVHPECPVETVEQEYLEPVREALSVLRAHTAAERVYLIGHSEGGMLAPYLVDACGFDGGVALAGTPLQLWEISYAQNLALLAAMPEAQQEVLRMQVEAEREKALTLPQMSDAQAASTTVFGVSAVYQRHLAQMDQAQIAVNCEKPFLFLWGEADFQVERAAFEAWETRLGADARFAYKTYPGLNHLFMPADEGDSILNAQAAYRTPKLMEGRVAADIAAWMLAQ